jgi:hypothetical protein
MILSLIPLKRAQLDPYITRGRGMSDATTFKFIVTCELLRILAF